MKKTYWVKKNPNNETEWIEMTGKEFYDFITSPAGKGRYFIDFGIYKIEATQEQYRQWKREANHRTYLQGFEDEVLILSLEKLAENENNDSFYDEVTADSSVNIEDEIIDVMDLELLSKAIQSLPDDERKLLEELYLRDMPKTEQEIATETGVRQQAVNKKKNKIIKKLKMMVVK